MKNRKALGLLFTANAISGFAQGVSMLAIPWYFAKQGSSSDFNMIFGLVTFANLFWGIYAGTLVDRFKRKSLFLFTNVLEGSIILPIGIYGLLQGQISDVLIVVVFATTIFGYRMHYPNLYAFSQEITPPSYYTKVTSYIEIVGQTTNVMAGALAVILLEGIDVSWEIPLIGSINIHVVSWEIYEIFMLDAVTYFISSILISFIRYTPDKKFIADEGKLTKRLITGFKYLKDQPIILLFGFFSHSIFVVMLVSLFAVMPMYITNFLHEGGDVFGTMEILYGLGALSSGLFISKLTQNFSKIASIIVLMFTTTLILAMCMVVDFVFFYFLVGFVIGFTNAGTRILRISYLFNHIPNQVIGRVNSIFSLLNIVVRGLFIMLFSLTFFNQGQNIIYAYGIMALFTAFSGIMLLKNYTKIRKTDHQ